MRYTVQRILPVRKKIFVQWFAEGIETKRRPETKYILETAHSRGKCDKLKFAAKGISSQSVQS